LTSLEPAIGDGFDPGLAASLGHANRRRLPLLESKHRLGSQQAPNVVSPKRPHTGS
jgi:hypothetical protein